MDILPERIRKAVIPRQLPNMSDPCWEWQRCVTKGGYGRIVIEGRCHIVHRWVYTHLNGPVGRWVDIHHLCENPRCCNPAHLKALTRKEHLHIDGRAKINGRRASVGTYQRNKTHCPEGHEYTPENTRVNLKGYRWCKACAKAKGASYLKAWRARKKDTVGGVPSN